MLKTRRNGQTWLVSQPDHGAVAGYLAAHWGNDQFRAPGQFGKTPDAMRLRAETVLAIAEHDNGWWEWEAAPEVEDLDNLPLDLSDVLKNQQDGMNRWRLGVPRLADSHPYASLLISFHAFWLYAVKVDPDADPAFLHPLFWKGKPEKLVTGPRDEAGRFIEEIRGMQESYVARLREDTQTASWVEAESLKPNVRMLQLLDGLSLSLCSPLIPALHGDARGLGEDAFDLLDVPRADWEDRVTIAVRPAGERRVTLDPYPFALNPLRVVVPARVVDPASKNGGPFHAWWHALQPQQVEFEFRAK